MNEVLDHEWVDLIKKFVPKDYEEGCFYEVGIDVDTPEQETVFFKYSKNWDEKLYDMDKDGNFHDRSLAKYSYRIKGQDWQNIGKTIEGENV